MSPIDSAILGASISLCSAALGIDPVVALRFRWRRWIAPPHTTTSLALGGGGQPKPTLFFQLLEVTIISAQDMDTAHKLTTWIDHVGRANPTCNNKFLFLVDDGFLPSETSAVMIQIYGSYCPFQGEETSISVDQKVHFTKGVKKVRNRDACEALREGFISV